MIEPSSYAIVTVEGSLLLLAPAPVPVPVPAAIDDEASDAIEALSCP